MPAGYVVRVPAQGAKVNGPARRWEGTGQRYEASSSGDRIPAFDPRSGNHYWILITTYNVDPSLWSDPTHTPMLDTENLVLITGPGCFYCEQHYDQVKHRRCKGQP